MNSTEKFMLSIVAGMVFWKVVDVLRHANAGQSVMAGGGTADRAQVEIARAALTQGGVLDSWGQGDGGFW